MGRILTINNPKNSYLYLFMALGESHMKQPWFSAFEISCQVGDLPEDQITLRALRDVNVPKFLKAEMAGKTWRRCLFWMGNDWNDDQSWDFRLSNCKLTFYTFFIITLFFWFSSCPLIFRQASRKIARCGKMSLVSCQDDLPLFESGPHLFGPLVILPLCNTDSHKYQPKYP